LKIRTVTAVFGVLVAWAALAPVVYGAAPKVGRATIAFNGKPAPTASASASGFSVVAGADGPQLALFGGGLVLALRRGEQVDIRIPMTAVPDEFTLAAEATLVSGAGADVELALDGAVLSAVYRFRLDEENVTVQPGGRDPHLVATLKTRNEKIQVGADGIDFDKDGNLLVANCGDATIEKIVLDGKGKAVKQTVFAGPGRMRSTDGIFYDARTEVLYVADILGNAVLAVSPAGKVTEVARNGDCTGANGLLDGPSEAVVRGDEIIVANFDRVFPGSVNTKPDKPYTLSVIKTGGTSEKNSREQ
jgi:hypothetical protein